VIFNPIVRRRILPLSVSGLKVLSINEVWYDSNFMSLSNENEKWLNIT